LWVYDVLGRRASERVGAGLVTSYQYDAADQLVSTTQGTVVNTFGYNANGDQTIAPGTVSSFNAARQTVSVAGSGGMVTYGCDGNGNRTSSMVAGVTTRFDWDTVSGGLANVTAESVAGTVIRKYAYGHDMVRTTNGTSNSFLFADPVGTVTHLVSSSGAVQAQYLTGAYGVNKTTSVIDPVVASNPIRFTGQYTDPITGNVYLRARQYNPAFGAFTQTDPLQADIGSPYPSAYIYGNNNPLMYTDPSGLRGQSAQGSANPVRAGGPGAPNELALTFQSGDGPTSDQLHSKDRTSAHNMLVQIQYAFCFARYQGQCLRDRSIPGASKKGNGNAGFADLMFVTRSGTRQVAEVKAWSERAKVLPEAMAYAAAETAATGAPATVAVTFDANVWAPVGGFTVGGKGHTFTAVPGGFVYRDVDRKPKRKRVRVRVPDPTPILEALAETE
jgi:RHS repeat-associated protein